VPDPQKLFSWWSYRAVDFRASNRGLRLDHLWASPGLLPTATRNGKVSAFVHDSAREWDKPSDHAPVVVDLDV
jgi:exodeoxyribonuclease-3